MGVVCNGVAMVACLHEASREYVGATQRSLRDVADDLDIDDLTSSFWRVTIRFNFLYIVCSMIMCNDISTYMTSAPRSSLLVHCN
jgi:hypothetical protein